MDKRIREMIDKWKEGVEVRSAEDKCAGEGINPEWTEERGQLVISAPPISDCTMCGGAGYTTSTKDGYQYAVSCRGGKLRDLAFRTQWANIPASYANAGLGDVHDALREATSSISPGDKGLWLYGPPGTGKTHAAIAMAKSLVIRHRVRFQPVLDLLSEIKRSYSNAEVSEDEIIAKVAAFPFLVLDDIGQMHRGGEFELRILFEIFDRRLRSGGTTTIVTSNPSPKELDGTADWHGKRITSRLHALTYPIAITGEDRRK